ncbi:MAG: hypothetical protein GOP50_07085 [Candidatus Heimdallarchaeota archaeon]|nr:hypothetical protein [Candidatus Heimdallarchaeota archaeon]
MKKTKVSFLAIIGMLLLLISSSSNLVSSQEYVYPVEFDVGATYDWEVIDLLVSGTISTPYLNYGSEVLKQGDVISVKILQNVNNVTNGTPSELQDPSNIWAEFYLNGDFQTNETEDIGLFVLDWLDFANIYTDYFFIQPITYENETGIYNYFEILHNNFPQVNERSTEEFETHEVYSFTKTNLVQTSKLTSKSWTVRMELTEEERTEDLEVPWEKTLTKTTEIIEIRFNVDTGLLSYIKYDFKEHFEREIDGSIDIDDDIVFLHIESTSVPVGVPFNWAFSFLGLIVIGLVVYRKRKK